MKPENARTRAQGHQQGEAVQAEEAEVVEEEINPELHTVSYVGRMLATLQENANIAKWQRNRKKKMTLQQSAKLRSTSSTTHHENQPEANPVCSTRTHSRPIRNHISTSSTTGSIHPSIPISNTTKEFPK
jgi:hypothetical protein